MTKMITLPDGTTAESYTIEELELLVIAELERDPTTSAMKPMLKRFIRGLFNEVKANSAARAAEENTSSERSC